MTQIKAFIKQYAKSVAAWVAGVVVTMVTNLINGASAWPQTGAQWTQYALASFGAALVVAIAPTNKITQKQLDKDPNVIGGVVVSDAQIATAVVNPATGSGYQNPWQA